MKHFILAFCLAFASMLHAQTNLTFDYGGLTREYILYLPAAASSGAALPLVYNFHGYTNNMTFQMNYSEMNTIAEANDFIVVYPQGTADSFGINHWNAWQDPTDVDDIGFISALTDYLIANYNVNPQRVYSCGFSNGGIFSYALAAQLSTKIAAIASVAGTMSETMITLANPQRQVPVFHIHGTSDPVVPIDGSAGQTPGFGTLTSAPATLAYWNSFDACTTDATSGIQNTSLIDLCTAQKTVYSNCGEHDNWYIEIASGGHTWPGSTPLVVTGNTCQDFDASQEIWNFFSQIQMPVGVIELSNEKGASIQAVYGLDGTKLSTTAIRGQHGYFVIQYTDFTTKKIFIP